MTCGETNSVQKIKSQNVKYKTTEKTGISTKFGGRIMCHVGVDILTDHTDHVLCRRWENGKDD